jgi:hypothetical protein
VKAEGYGNSKPLLIYTSLTEQVVGTGIGGSASAVDTTSEAILCSGRIAGSDSNNIEIYLPISLVLEPSS